MHSMNIRTVHNYLYSVYVGKYSYFLSIEQMEEALSLIPEKAKEYVRKCPVANAKGTGDRWTASETSIEGLDEVKSMTLRVSLEMWIQRGLLPVITLTAFPGGKYIHRAEIPPLRKRLIDFLKQEF